jgi:hypothetical protein
MNERIKELAKQAEFSKNELHTQGDNFQRFAELIIQDCLAQVAMIGISNFENDDHGDISWTVSKCIEMIKYRFEIKE